MTWKQQHTKNKRFIRLYMEYLACPTTKLSYDDSLKLITEIGRLKLQNDWIDNMTVEDYYKDAHDWNIKKNAS